MVRLKPLEPILWLWLITVSIPQNGSIKTVGQSLELFHYQKFQFHNGSIKTNEDFDKYDEVE